jgi:hypothetical protein
MGPEDSDCMNEIAGRALKRLDALILVMELAADQVARGGAPGDIDVGDYQLYMAEGSEQAIVCVLNAEEYFDLLDAVVSEAGVCLEDTEELIVHVPDPEFEESLVTGGFMAWKGFAVEKKNRRLEELLDCIRRKLLDRGLTMNCNDEDYVIFRLPIQRQE